jgi:hypothetical protein
MPSMIVSQKLFPALKKVMFTATAVLALMQCSEEDTLVNPVAPQATVANASTENISASSLTVTGSNTAYTTLTDCKTCTYVVSANEEIIDGKAMGFKPGNIICLNKGVKYGNLEFVNLDGTPEKPILIATVKSQLDTPIVAQSSEQDPY